MKTLLKINNSELSYRLNLNYNNVYSRLKMLLGRKASLFADISTKSSGTTWYSDDDAEYTRLSEAPKEEVNALSVALNDAVYGVRKELSASPELSSYVDDILEIPDNSFVFYRKNADGYKFILAGWGCKFAHQSATDPNAGFIKRMSKNLDMPDSPALETPGKKENISDLLAGIHNDEPKKTETISPVTENLMNPGERIQQTAEGLVEPDKDVIPEDIVKKETIQDEVKFEKKTQNVVIRVLDQNNHPVAGEIVTISTKDGESTKVTSDEGTAIVGKLPYGDSFGVTFPNIQGNHERAYEVEPNVEVYDAFIKKLVKYSPVLFVEDQNGNSVQDYNVKIVINGQDSIYNTGMDGVIQLPTMQEGQKFIAIDTANYANTEEFNITQAEAKTPYHFHIKRAEKTKVGITVLDKSGNPIPKATVDLAIGDTPCQQITSEDGRAEFPYDVFSNGEIPVNLIVKGKGQIKSKLNYTSDITEYTIQLQDGNARGGGKGFNWKWLAILPLLLLLGLGGYKLYQSYPWGTPSVKEMESGVVLVQSKCIYFVETGMTTSDGKPQRFFFEYDSNERKATKGTFDETEAAKFVQLATGTGFLISKDGLIATNRHVADPIPPDGVSVQVKQLIFDEKKDYEKNKSKIEDDLRTIGPLRMMDPQYEALYEEKQKQLELLNNYIDICEKVLTLGEFKVKVECQTSVAFVNSIIESWDDFVGCSFRVSGNPGDVDEKDVAIIQLKNKERDIPKDAFIFTVPEKDLMDEQLPDEYKVTVLGYNAGITLADIKNGIHPQPTPGQVTMNTDKFNFGYDANTFTGSSGSPVINAKGQLVGVNNANLGNGSGKGFAVRTKYLKELLDDVVGTKKNNN